MKHILFLFFIVQGIYSIILDGNVNSTEWPSSTKVSDSDSGSEWYVNIVVMWIKYLQRYFFWNATEFLLAITPTSPLSANEHFFISFGFSPSPEDLSGKIYFFKKKNNIYYCCIFFNLPRTVNSTFSTDGVTVDIPFDADAIMDINITGIYMWKRNISGSDWDIWNLSLNWAVSTSYEVSITDALFVNSPPVSLYVAGFSSKTNPYAIQVAPAVGTHFGYVFLTENDLTRKGFYN